VENAQLQGTAVDRFRSTVVNCASITVALKQKEALSVRRTCLVALLILCNVSVASEPDGPEFGPLFHLPFDGSASAAVPQSGVTVTGGDQLKFAEGKVGKAADFLERGDLEYRDLPMPDPKAGTLELWIKSAHDGKEMEDHYFLRFLREDGSAAIDIQFYHVELSAQVTMWGPTGQSRRYAWGWAKDDWQHIVVAWDSTDSDNTDLMLYRIGVESGHATPYRPFHRPSLLRVGCKSPEEGGLARALIDEVAVYSRCLTKSQVTLLYENGGQPFEKKLATLRARVAEDDATRERRKHLLFHVKKLAIIHGRNTSLLHWPDSRFASLGLPVPAKVHETELMKTDMNQYDAVIVPGGGGLNLDDANRDALQAYVRQGGGYVGICGGATSAAKYGLVAAKRYGFDVRGAVYSTLKQHPVTEGYDTRRKLLIPHASGPLFVLDEGTDETPVVVFNIGGGDLPVFVNVIARKYGEGRVAVFSCHPEASPRSYRLLRNAVMWTARIIEPENTLEPKP